MSQRCGGLTGGGGGGSSRVALPWSPPKGKWHVCVRALKRSFHYQPLKIIRGIGHLDVLVIGKSPCWILGACLHRLPFTLNDCEGMGSMAYLHAMVAVCKFASRLIWKTEQF